VWNSQILIVPAVKICKHCLQTAYASGGLPPRSQYRLPSLRPWTSLGDFRLLDLLGYNPLWKFLSPQLAVNSTGLFCFSVLSHLYCTFLSFRVLYDLLCCTWDSHRLQRVLSCFFLILCFRRFSVLLYWLCVLRLLSVGVINEIKLTPHSQAFECNIRIMYSSLQVLLCWGPTLWCLSFN